MLVIANPHAGHGRAGRTLAAVREFLDGHSIAHRIAVSAGPGDVTEIAARAVRQGEAPLVVVGGDGTLFEAVNGMARAGRFVPVAQVPVGTGNSFIKDLGIDTTEQGLAALLAGRTRAVDVGRLRCSGRELYFVNLVGAGFVADVAALAGRFKLFGDTSYTIAVLLELVRLRSTACHITADGVESTREAIFVEICNSRKTGGDMIMAPEARVDDGLFDVVIARAMSRPRLLGLFPRIFTGEHVKDPRVETFRCSRISVRFDRPQRVTPDGELLGMTPLEVDVLPRALEVFTA